MTVSHPPATAPTTDAPLAGLTVLEIGVFMAAPFATMQLADLGARVVKVENPLGPDPTRASGPFLDGSGPGRHSSPFARLNRNKESVALDLKSDAGRAAFLRLVQRADALVENLRPGALRRLGLGYEEVAAVNPRLVYASASGFGQDGPLAPLPGLDIMAQARSGLMSITGTPDGDPVKVGVPICDLVGGLYTALAVTAALHRRGPDGEGQYVDVSLLETGVSLAVWEAGTFFATGEVGRPLGSAHQTQAPYQAVRCRDGWVTLGAITAKTWDGLCAALDLPGLRGEPRYVDSASRRAHRAELVAAIEEATGGWDSAALVAALEAEGVPCAPINDYGEVFTDEHLTERGFFWDAEHPDLGPVRQLGSPMRLSGTPTRRDGAGPPLGADTRAVLAEAGYADAEIEALGRGRGGAVSRDADADAAPRGPQQCDAAPTGAQQCGTAPTEAQQCDVAPTGAQQGDVAPIRVERDGAALHVTFDRPHAHNAMTFAMYEGLHDACETADADEAVRVLVLRGAGGRAFVSGTDIAQFTGFDGPAGVRYEQRITRVVRRLEDVTVPTVAAVEGYCVGGGLALAAACDLRVATGSARFGVPIARTLGNCLSMDTHALLVAHLGPARTLDLLLRARLLSGAEAHASGFVGELVADGGALDAAVRELVDTFAGHAPLTMWAAKRATARLRRAALPDGDDLVERVYGSADFAAAAAAFGSRERPAWTGA